MDPRPAVKVIISTYRVVDDGHGGSCPSGIRSTSVWHRYDSKADVNTPLAEWLAEKVIDAVGLTDNGTEIGQYYGEPQTSTGGVTTEVFATFKNVADEVEDAAHEIILRRRA